ncbi:Alkylated DNA repair protein alkB 8 [Rhizophlyctis rosea]|nr:Alkylated DNA repair protein alkB 8 [Rhizophlyctis rosea]
MASTPVPEVPGLLLVFNIMSANDETTLINLIKENPGHFVQQIHPAQEFGWRFLKRSNSSHSVSPLTMHDCLGIFPDWLQHLWSMCVPHIAHKDALMEQPDHALINTYAPGDGCVAHTDQQVFWTTWVVGVSFGSGCEMEFRRVDPLHGAPVKVYVPPRSMYVMTGDARYKFTHGFSFRTHDGEVPRGERISITFRAISPKYLSDELRAMVLSKEVSA